MVRYLLVCLLLLPTALYSQAKQDESVLAVVGARLLPVSSEPIDDGLILIRGSRIVYAGPRSGKEIPEGASVIDGSGLTACPGFVDARSNLFLGSLETSRPSSGADVRALDGVDPYDPEVRVVLEAGVTCVFVGPPRGAGVNGQGAVLKLRSGRPAVELRLESDGTMKASLGTSARNPGPVTRIGQEAAIVGRLKAADGYRKSKERYEKALKAYEKALAEYKKKAGTAGKKKEAKKDEKKAPPGEEKKAPKKAEPKEPVKPEPPAVDAKIEALLQVLSRSAVLRVEAYRAGDLLAALRILDSYPVRLVLEGAEEADRVADAIRRARVSAVIGPLLTDDPEKEAGLAATLSEKGIPFAIATFAGPGRSSRFLPLHAAEAVRAGLSREAALRAITLQAARICGVAGRVGSLEAGKDADVVLLTGHPLDSRSRVLRVILDGETVIEETP